MADDPKPIKVDDFMFALVAQCIWTREGEDREKAARAYEVAQTAIRYLTTANGAERAKLESVVDRMYDAEMSRKTRIIDALCKTVRTEAPAWKKQKRPEGRTEGVIVFLDWLKTQVSDEFDAIDAATVSDLFSRWVPKKPGKGKLATEGVVGMLILRAEALGFKRQEDRAPSYDKARTRAEDEQRARALVTTSQNRIKARDRVKR